MTEKASTLYISTLYMYNVYNTHTNIIILNFFFSFFHPLIYISIQSLMKYIIKIRDKKNIRYESSMKKLWKKI